MHGSIHGYDPGLLETHQKMITLSFAASQAAHKEAAAAQKDNDLFMMVSSLNRLDLELFGAGTQRTAAFFWRIRVIAFS